MTTATPAVLAASGLNVAYGEAKVLFDVDLDVAANQIVACVGRNGAGKTTLLRTLAGFLRPTSGTIRAGDAALVGQMPYDIARLGVKYVPQDKKVFSDLTVRENLELASFGVKDHDWTPVLTYFPKLNVLMDRKAGYLSGGERQMLMIGRAILGQPKVLLIDEPTEGLAPSIVAHLRTVFTELARSMALVIVEQNLPLVCAIADRVCALRDGRIVATLQGQDAIRPEHCEPYL